MAYRLSLLDKSPIRTGETAADALKQTLALARRAEDLHYHRFWVAEHHNSTQLAGAAPEVLATWILANTARIRVGSGGVMLQHYSPYKVAEVFNVLSSLAPGRVDLGVGKTPGGLPLATAALQAFHDKANKPSFEEQLATLTAFLEEQPREDRKLSATPRPPVAPERFLLGASPASASLAAAHGWIYVHAGHLNGDADNLKASLETYRRESGRAPVLALSALASENAAHAAAQVAGLKVYKIFFGNGQAFNLGSREQAEEFARQAGETDYRIEELRPNVLAGTADSIHAELASLAATYGIEEFVIEPPPVGADERLQSIEHLARHMLPIAA